MTGSINVSHFWKSALSGPDKGLRIVSIIGSAYFMLTALFSVIHFEHKFLYDGTSLVFHIANAKSFPLAFQREVFYLQQFIPVLIAKAGGGLPAVMIGYVLNVYALYYAIFYIVVFILKDAACGVLYLLVHFRGDPFNYYVMVEELLPGACFVVLLYALLRNADRFQNVRWVYLAAATCIIFVVRSHPLALVALVLSTPLLILRNWIEVRRHWKGVMLASIVFLVLIGAKFLNLNAYDAGRIDEAKTFGQALLELTDPIYLLSMTWFVFGERIFMLGTCLLMVFYLVKEKRFMELSVVAVILLLAVVLFNMNAHDIRGLRLWANYLKYDQWSLPIRFTMFTAFSLLVPIEFFRRYKKGLLAMLPILLFVSLLQLQHAHRISEEYLVQVRDIIETCEEESAFKAIVPFSDVGQWPPVHNTAFRDVLVYSSLWEGPTIQVVYENPDLDYSMLTDSCEELIIIDQGGPLIPQDQLDTNIFPLEEGNYTYVSFDKDSS